MGLFKNIGKSLKKAAPLIGAGIGMYFGGPMGAGFGSGIGTLLGGGSAEDALLAGALGYAGGSLAQGYVPTAAGPATKGVFASNAAKAAAAQKQAAFSKMAAGAPPGMMPQISTTPAGGSSILGGIGDFMADNKMLTAGLGIGALGLLAGGEEEEGEASPFPETREGRPYETKVKGPITGTTYNLANEDEVEAYNNELLQLREKSFKYEAGGEVTGPGTGTSDSVPARLSDGEFVLTAKAVRGAGNGDRDIGAARMYDMMAELESMA
jgi:hypothetical protein